MPKPKEGLFEMVKETGASLGEAVTVVVEAATDYLRPTKRRPTAKKNRSTTSPQRRRAAAPTQRKTAAPKRSHPAMSAKRSSSVPGRGKPTKMKSAAKGKTVARGKR